MPPRPAFSLVLPFALLVCAFASAQGYRIRQNDAPATEFIAARWHFGTNGAIGHMGWSHNYPNSDRNLNEFLPHFLSLIRFDCANRHGVLKDQLPRD